MTSVPQASVELFSCIGLSEKQAKGFLKNSKVAEALTEAIVAGGFDCHPCDAKTGNLVVSAVTNLPPTAAGFRSFLIKYIAEGKIKSNPQVDAAINEIKRANTASDNEIDVARFEEACGVGVEVSHDEIKTAVSACIDAVRSQLLEERYAFSTSKLLYEIRQGRMQWADGKSVKTELDNQVTALLGPKTEADIAAAQELKKDKKKKDKSKQKAKPAATSATAAASKAAKEEFAFAGRELGSAKNTKELLEEHRSVTGGRIRARFPPEPNGYLHIGHAKSMNLNFDGVFRAIGLSEAHDTIFRYDDTNPEAESHEYIDSQAQNVQWLGWKPCRVTHSSDYFCELYELAVKLIRKGKAYVCHQTKAEIEKSRETARAKIADPSTPGSAESPWRDRTVEENLREFEKMRLGLYDEGKATLRMKIDMSHPNPNMWDPVAYRIKFVPHPMTGDQWCIYPSYDFTHCLVDSLEHIDYSLCTLEFESRRDSYYWLLKELDMWRPAVWEFARLDMTHTLLSKRKILKLIQMKAVRGWDDPRLFTLMGMQRRGFTPESINNFCREIGVTRNNNLTDLKLLEHCLRTHLDTTARRAFGVLSPLKVVLTNYPENKLEWINVYNFPKEKEMGVHRVALQRVVYIDSEDFKVVDEKGYKRLAPGQTVGLLYAGNITCTDVVQAPDGTVVEVRCEYEAERSTKPRGNIHWVCGSEIGEKPAKAEIRLYDHLFTTEVVGSTGDWLGEMNPDSETIISDAFIDQSIADANVGSRFQFERVGFFIVDKDSSDGRMVFNRTITLRESADLKKMTGRRS